MVEIVLAQGDSKSSRFEVLQKTELLTPEFIGLVAIFIKYKGWIDSLPPHDALLPSMQKRCAC